ncbi:DUF3100 domain-containing protein [Lederbergia sp. NSJ-179]|uniref:DUF3100 domain-containing protein n=1 Tax=Lederbergia sp. NSJ-179 TaxID=2931402 RepID=UPI001FD4357B|nr:DUF3100 domain-containing protein [Lederbergia sp. NSJ-179]MCJ7843145.1 DUF3100 domain-containing protein [Lederbergia sp. NSJ-179]
MKRNFLFLLIFVLLVIAIAEWIGFQSIPIGKFNIGLLPLVFAIIITMILGIQFFRKGIIKKIYRKENVNFASKYLIFIMLPLMARYGADVAPKLKEILSIGWVFLIQEIGNLGTVVLGLPIALLIGLRREAIGATLGIGREGELAYISEKYTLESPEGRGVLSLYIIGTLFGAIFFSVFAPVLLDMGFRVEALAMASGVGSGSMMTAASSSLVARVPELGDTIRAYASASQLLTSFLGTFTMVFLAAPLQKFMYKVFIRGDK